MLYFDENLMWLDYLNLLFQSLLSVACLMEFRRRPRFPRVASRR